MPLLPLLDRIESRFDIHQASVWMEQNWSWSIYVSLLYLMLVVAGRQWMQSRSPFNLRKMLIMWNTGLATFSVCGTLTVVPPLIRNLIVYPVGITRTLCYTEAVYVPRLALWSYVFAISKLIELGDTAFIVLRKTPLSFLHCYHHISVLVFTWYGVQSGNPGVCYWFCCMNYTVHSLMYTYYAFKASGVKFPSRVSGIITLLQITQMFMGIYLNILAFVSKHHSDMKCGFHGDLLCFGMFMYVSYALLFVNFFYERYLRKTKNK